MSVFANLMSVKLLALACSGREGGIKKDGAKTEAKTRRNETKKEAHQKNAPAISTVTGKEEALLHMWGVEEAGKKGGACGRR
jgi:hypothetical protein